MRSVWSRSRLFSQAKRREITIATKFGYDIYNSVADPNQRERPQNW